jgi:hypothetical protein
MTKITTSKKVLKNLGESYNDLGRTITIDQYFRNEKSGKIHYICSCSKCSSDTVLFPKGSIKCTITTFKNKKVLCGCTPRYSYSAEQKDLIKTREKEKLLILKEGETIPHWIKFKASKPERFDYYYNLCDKKSKEKDNIFSGFTSTPENFTASTTCKLFCKVSSTYWETTTASIYINNPNCTCPVCYRDRLNHSAKLTKYAKGLLKYGVGFNDLACEIDYVSRDCPYYLRWHDLLRRCYHKKSLIKHPTYKEVVVCEEWLTFSNFKYWMEKQVWEDKHLDKDILVRGNKVYSPSTCVFVHNKVNQFLLERENDRGDYPIGVTLVGSGHFEASISNTFTGEIEHLGTYTNALDAHFAWKRRKHDLATKLAYSPFITDPRVAEVFMNRWKFVKVLEDFHKGALQ